MIRFFPIIIFIQALCIYHAYRNNSEQKWYWLIIVFPVVGTLIYLYHHFYSRQNIAKVSEGIKNVVNTNYQTEKLEKEVAHCGSIVNKKLLAENYVELGRYPEAISLYESCLNSFNQNDTDTLACLLKTYYLNNDFNKAVAIGEKLKDYKEFNDSENKIALAWSLYELNDIKSAQNTFFEMNKRYSHYNQRLEYSRFLLKTNQKEIALSVLDEVMAEYNDMESYQKKMYKGLAGKVRGLYNEVRNN